MSQNNCFLSHYTTAVLVQAVRTRTGVHVPYVWVPDTAATFMSCFECVMCDGQRCVVQLET